MGTIKLTIEYDGTAYAGWQRQAAQPTVQAAIETALTQITQQPIPVIAAGRTDAGVHARGQVASFHTEKPLPVDKWAAALNRYLPADIAVLSSEQVPESFHARYSAKEKLYEYLIYCGATRPVLNRHRVWHLPYTMDVPAIRQAAAHLIGHHDFTSFRGPRPGNFDPLCRLSHITIHPEGQTIRLTLQADRFLKQMVRAIVGTLAEVGRHARSPDSIREILHMKDRRAAGKTAPPQGLYLVCVWY